MQAHALAQRHVDGDVGSRAAGEEGGDAALAQAGEHQRIRVAAQLPEHEQRVDHQGDEQHAAHDHHQQLAVAEQRVETGLAHGGGDQAEDAERREADHHLHDRGHRVREVIDRLARTFGGMTQRDAEADRPRQDADEVRFHECAHRVGDHVEEQVLEHHQDATRRVAGRGCGVEHQRGREREAGKHGDQRGREGAEQVQDQHRAHVRGLPVLVVGDRRRHQHEDQDRRDGLQRGDEEVAEQRDRFGGARRDQRQGDAQDQTDGDLGNQAHAHEALQSRGGCGSHFMSPRYCFLLRA